MKPSAFRGFLLLSAAALVAAPAARAQAATIFGSLSNFDVLNDTGAETEGFEIELDGIQAQNVVYTFGGTYNRYGSPQIVPFAGGVYVRYMASYDAGTGLFNTATPVPTQLFVTAGHQCWSGAMGMAAYLASGCEHFGVSLGASPTSTTYRWLVADPSAPGSLIAIGTSVPIPTPTWQVYPPAQAGLPPVVVARIVPPPPRPELQFGDAQWVKVFKTELPREVGLDELQSDAAVVPAGDANLESPLSLLQTNPHRPDNGAHSNSGGVNSGSRSVVRRYEFYKYTGKYDALSHEALCIDPTCKTADASEVGDYIGAQMAAANIGVPSVTVARSGNGNVQSPDSKLKCGGVCTVTAAAGATVTLSASPSSGNAFTGWSGACGGANPTCALTVNDQLTATATFTPLFTVSLSGSNSGSITGTPNGDKGQLSCPGNCSLKFPQGTLLTLTATPAAGLRFLSWTGACAGNNGPTCALVISGNASAGATFGK